MWQLLERIRVEHPSVLVRAFHDDVVVVRPPGALRACWTAPHGWRGRRTRCWSHPSAWGGRRRGGGAPPRWTAQWHAEGLTQFSVPLGTPDYLAAAVDGLAIEQVALCDAIAALPPDALHVQLLLLRLCAKPQAIYLLRALPLAEGAKLAGAVDRGAQRALCVLLCDARDDAATQAADVARVALPVAMGGLGIGRQTAVAPAAALASWVDALRAGRSYSPTLRASADALLRLPGAGREAGGCLAGGPCPSFRSGRDDGSPPRRVAPAAPLPHCPAAPCRPRAARVAPPAALAPPVSRGPPARGATAGAALPWATGVSATPTAAVIPNVSAPPAVGGDSARFEPPPAEAARPRVTRPYEGCVRYPRRRRRRPTANSLVPLRRRRRRRRPHRRSPQPWPPCVATCSTCATPSPRTP